MDALTSVLLYACAAVAVAGSLGAAIAPPGFRSLSLILMTAGTAAVLALLSAGFAAVVFGVVGVASALVIGSSGGASPAAAVPSWGGVVASALFLVLAYAAFRGALGHGGYPGGLFNSATVSRLLIDRDAMAGVAVGGLLLVAVAGAAASWRTGRR